MVDGSDNSDKSAMKFKPSVENGGKPSQPRSPIRVSEKERGRKKEKKR